jgi:hypothetical protein
LIPQAIAVEPELSWVKVPEGVSAAKSKAPQHATVPVDLIAQASCPPALIELSPGAAPATVNGDVVAVGAAEATPVANIAPALAAKMTATAPIPVMTPRQPWRCRRVPGSVISRVRHRPPAFATAAHTALTGLRTMDHVDPTIGLPRSRSPLL